MNHTHYIFHQPMKFIFVDDDKDFSMTLRNHLKHIRSIDVYSDPTEIDITRIKQNSQAFVESLEKIYMQPIDIGQTKIFNIPYLLSHLQSRINSDFRSAAIIDYQMPTMDGYTVSRSLSNLPICRILLTGLKEYENAISALNDGDIDMYVNKTSEDIARYLINDLHEIERHFYTNLTAISGILNNVTRCYAKLADDATYRNIRDSFLDINNICGYYLIDTRGSLLGLDNEGLKHWLFIFDQQTRNYFTSIANDEDSNQINSKLAQDHIPLLLTEESLQLPVGEWGDYMEKIKETRDHLSYVELNNKFPHALES